MRVLILPTLLMAVIVNGLQIDVVQQSSLETSQQGCDPLCHHLTTGPCQHPNLDDDTCMLYLEHSEDGIVTREDGTCPPGTIDCGWQPTLALNGTVIPPIFLSSSRTASKTPTSSISVTSSVTATRSVTVSPTTTRTPSSTPIQNFDSAFQQYSDPSVISGQVFGSLQQYYRMTFTVNIRNTVSDWGSIFHFTTGGNCCGWGQRVPGLWLSPGSTQLCYVAGAPQEGNWHVYSATNLPFNTDVEIEIWTYRDEAGNNKVSIRFSTGYEQIWQTHGGDRPAIDNVIFYRPDPWYQAMDGTVSNLEIEQFTYR